MSVRKKAEARSHGLVTNGKPDIVPQPLPEEVVEPFDSKFTYNARTDTESLTIRTNSERELEELIARWKFRIVPKREPKPKMNDGDECPSCDGIMTIQVGHNRKTGKEYNFLSCSNYPACNMTAYLAQTAQAQTA